MKLKTKQIIIFLIIILIIFIMFSRKSYAVSQMIDDADSFLSYGKDVEDVINTSQLKSTSDFIYKVGLSVAIVVALVVGVIIGIKYIYGGAEGQAKIKEAFIPYVVGCLIVFSAFPIWKIVVNFGNEQGMIKETHSYEESLSCIEEVKNIYSNKGKLNDASDYQIKGAWSYTKEYGFPAKDELEILYNNSNGFYGELYVEYLSRFESDSSIIEKWNQFTNRYWDRTNIEQWAGRKGEAVKTFYQLYCTAL